MNKEALSFDKNKKLIISRVLDYGLITDWKIILNRYGLQQIADTAIHIKELDKRSASFISLLSNIPKEKFQCYITKPSTPEHWNF